MNEFQLKDIPVDTTEKVLFISPVREYRQKSLFFINKGSNAVTFEVFGSPTGFDENSKKINGESYSASELNLHYKSISTVSVNGNANDMLNLTDEIYDYIKVIAKTTSGNSVVNIAIQGNYQD